MKYERLTERDERGFPCIKGVSPENLYKGIDDMNEAVSVTWAVKRLAELEDKIEVGTLVEVPKGAVVLTPEERADEMRLCNEERKQAVKEFVCKVLQIGSKRPLCLFNEYKEGYIDCLDQIKELAAQYGVEVKE